MKKVLAFVLMLCFAVGCHRAETVPTVEDTMSPYINMTQYEFYTEVNKPIDFSNIGGYDDIDGMLPTRLKGFVDYTTPGEYYPSIICRDLSGNESEVIITIHVVEEGELPVAPAVETPEPTPSTCANGMNPEQPCSMVLPETVAEYKTLYYGTEGKENCEAVNEEAGSCEMIYRNDGTLWGYGVK